MLLHDDEHTAHDKQRKGHDGLAQMMLLRLEECGDAGRYEASGECDFTGEVFVEEKPLFREAEEEVAVTSPCHDGHAGKIESIGEGKDKQSLIGLVEK